MEQIIEELRKYREKANVLRTILDTAYEGIIVVDNKGIITMLNKPYADILGIEASDAIGKHVTEVIENTRLHIILKTGKEEIGDIQQIGNNRIIAMRTPIIENNTITGAIGKIMFKNLEELNFLAKKLNALENELEYYKGELRKERGAKYSFDMISEASQSMKYIKDLAYKASHGNSTVLILGESGTGKELFAHSIHNQSSRYNGPFVMVNCAAIPPELLESELFGYEEGAFTGAKKGGKLGKFQLANGGTIFLDEIGDMPLNMQAKVLRVLQEREVERIGSSNPEPIDVRVIAATNRLLDKMVEERKFRGDLYYRLNVISITIPPLRERKDDIPVLSAMLLKRCCKEAGRIEPTISSEVMDIFKNYSWQGNVRELMNVLERAINVMDEKSSIVSTSHLPLYLIKEWKGNREETKSLKSILDEKEKETIIEALRYSRGSRTKAAKFLDVSRTTLYEKMLKHGIDNLEV